MAILGAVGMTRRQKGEQRQGVCAYCGVLGPMTRDHVFPVTLFLGSLDPQMITVPSCQACHDAKSAGDSALRDFVNLEIHGSRHPNALCHMEKIVRATETHRSLIGRAFLEQSVEQEWVTEAGVYLGQVVSVPADDFMDTVLRTIEYIVRGLYRYETRTNLPPESPVMARYIEPHKVPQVLADLRRWPPTKVTIKGHHVAGAVSWRPPEEPLATMWLVGFNNAVFFLGVTGQLAEEWRRLRE